VTFRLRYFALGAVAVLGIVFVVVLAHSARRLGASNSRVNESRNGVFVYPHKQRCQRGEYVPAAANRLRVYPGTSSPGGPPIVVTLRTDGGRVVSRIPIAGGYRTAVPRKDEGRPLDVPLPANHPGIPLGELCIKNLGDKQVNFGGNLVSANPAAPGGVNGYQERPTDEIRADYYLPGYRSGFKMAPTVIQRAALLRPGFMGAWTIWLLLGVFAAACAGTIFWFVRRGEEELA
jgi:hypothetical protein